MQSKQSLGLKLLSMLLVIALPTTQVMGQVIRNPINPGAPEKPIWEYIVDKAYEGEAEVETGEKEQLTRLLFADYLEYLNAVGVELASYESSIQARQEIKVYGECTDDTLRAYNQLLLNSIESDASSFTDAYCKSPCRTKAEFDFSLIATIDRPEGGAKSCQDIAAEMYESYHCEQIGGVGFKPSEGGLSDKAETTSDIFSDINLSNLLDSGRDTFNIDPGSLDPGSSKIKLDASGFGRTARITDGGIVTKPSTSASGGKFKVPSKTDMVSAKINIDQDFKSALNKKKSACEKKRSDLDRQTFSQPDGSPAGISMGTKPRNPLDPSWTTVSQDKANPKDIQKVTPQPKNPACKFAEGDSAGHYAKLRTAYNRISVEKINVILGHWPIYDENDVPEKTTIRLILKPADQFFSQLIDDLEETFNKACGAGGQGERSDVQEKSKSTGGRIVITGVQGGPDVDLNAPEPGTNNDKPTQEEKKPDPATVATYFSANQSLIDAFMNSALLGAEGTGAGTHTEVRAGEIAAGVQGGTIPPENIGEEAARGPLGKNAAEIEKLTREYLGQGDYRGIQIVVANIAGGITTGAVISGGVKLTGSMISQVRGPSNSGQISAFFTSLGKMMMAPMLPGSQTGALGPVAVKAFYKTTKEATEAAAKLGYKKVQGAMVRGQAVYTNGQYYISRDIDAHNGGVWKMAKSVVDLGSKKTRLGTYDQFLNWIGE
jgi:hypothetical protein